MIYKVILHYGVGDVIYIAHGIRQAIEIQAVYEDDCEVSIVPDVFSYIKQQKQRGLI